jgi:hypothetical protein
MWSITVVDTAIGWKIAPDELAEKPWSMDIATHPQEIVTMFEFLGFSVEKHEVNILNPDHPDPRLWNIDYNPEDGESNAVRLILER